MRQLKFVSKWSEIIITINWIILFMTFILTYILFNMINYYIFTPTIKKTSSFKLTHNFLNWKW